MPEASAPLALVRMAGFLALAGAALTVGVRMLRLWRQSGQLPELMLGSHILILISGYALEFGGMLGEGVLGEGGAWALRAAGNLCYAVSILSYLVFNWRVFRPQSRVAAAVALACTVGLVVGYTGELLTGRFELVPERFALPWFWIAYVPRLVTMGWAAGEGLGHWGLMRRRARLGIESPLLAHRFLLWGMAAASELAIYFVAGAALLSPTPTAFLVGTPALLISALGVAGAATIYLAFLPPGFYRRWVLSGSAA